MILLCLGKRRNVTRGKIKIIMWLFLYCNLTLGDNLSNTVLFWSCWIEIIRPLSHTTYLSRLTLTSVLIVEGLPLLESSFTYLLPFWIFWASQENVWATWCYFIHLLKYFKCFDWVLPDLSVGYHAPFPTQWTSPSVIYSSSY